MKKNKTIYYILGAAAIYYSYYYFKNKKKETNVVLPFELPKIVNNTVESVPNPVNITRPTLIQYTPTIIENKSPNIVESIWTEIKNATGIDTPVIPDTYQTFYKVDPNITQNVDTYQTYYGEPGSSIEITESDRGFVAGMYKKVPHSC